MNKNNYRKIQTILIIGLPIWGILFANLAVAAHFKNFCLIKFLTHHECWGCGLTRAFVEFCKFNFKHAYNYNPLIFIVVPVLLIIWFLLVKNEYKQSKKLLSNKKGTD